MAHLPTKRDFEELRADIRGLQGENAKIREDVACLRDSAKERDRRIELLEMLSRRNNLILRGLGFQEADDLRQVVRRFFTEVLKVEESLDIDSVRVLGPRRSGGGILLVTMGSSHGKWTVINNSKCLKGTCYSVSQDFPPNMRVRVSKLLRIRAELRKHNGNLECRMRSDKLDVQGKTYVWDEAIGLRELKAAGPTTIIAGTDLTDLVTRLRAERVQGGDPGT